MTLFLVVWIVSIIIAVTVIARTLNSQKSLPCPKCGRSTAYDPFLAEWDNKGRDHYCNVCHYKF